MNKEQQEKSELNLIGYGNIQTKNHGIVEAKEYREYLKFAVVLRYLKNNTLGVEVNYKYNNNDLLKNVLESMVDDITTGADYRTDEQGTFETLMYMKTTNLFLNSLEK